MFAFDLTVPRGVSTLHAEFEVDAVPDAGYQNAQRTSTESLAIVLWSQDVVHFRNRCQLVFFLHETRPQEFRLNAVSDAIPAIVSDMQIVRWHVLPGRLDDYSPARLYHATRRALVADQQDHGR